MAKAQIDIASWDPNKGFLANKSILFKVYDFYGNLYNQNSGLRWAAMANLAGSVVYQGLKDSQTLVDAYRENNFNPQTNLFNGIAANYADWLNSKLLEMQKAIFLDLAGQHHGLALKKGQ